MRIYSFFQGERRQTLVPPLPGLPRCAGVTFGGRSASVAVGECLPLLPLFAVLWVQVHCKPACVSLGL